MSDDWAEWSKAIKAQTLSTQTPKLKTTPAFTPAHMWMAFEAGVLVGGALWMLVWVVFS